MPCARLSWPFRQYLRSRKYIVSYSIVLQFSDVTEPLPHGVQTLWSLRFISRLLDGHTSGKINHEVSHVMMSLNSAEVAIFTFHKIV